MTREDCMKVLRRAKKPLTTKEVSIRGKMNGGTAGSLLGKLYKAKLVKYKMIHDGHYYRFLWSLK